MRFAVPWACSSLRVAMQDNSDSMTAIPESQELLRKLLAEALARHDDLAASLAAAGSEHARVVAERDRIATELDRVTADLQELQAANERLQHVLAKLRRNRFGRKSEQLSQEQLQFALEEIEASIAGNDAAAEKAKGRKARTRRREGRGRLPGHLPRRDVLLAPESDLCPCCAGRMEKIGEDVSERLDVLPAKFQVLRTTRPKLACTACGDQVVQVPAPARLIEGGMPTEAMVAQVLVSRYADHLPLYRQSQILARQGIEIGREVLASWIGAAAVELKPVVQRLHEILLGSDRLFADETVLPVLDPGRGKTKKGYAWTITRDDRPWGGTEPPAVVFHYAPGRGAEHARALLKGFQGILQCDGYAAYQTLLHVSGCEGLVLVWCWGHGRRNFFELAASKTAPIAQEALRRIAALYAIEEKINGKPPSERLAVRQVESRPLVEDLFTWLGVKLAQLPTNSPTAKAVRYLLAHRAGLELFLADGRIDLDTNAVERSIRGLVLSRKNALFASGDDGGDRWAVLASLVETCKLNGVNTERYFTDVLTRLVNGWPARRIDELMPWHWAERPPA
jgi:transposase